MTTTLTAAQTRVAAYLDDVANADASPTQISDALKPAQTAVYQMATTIAPHRFIQESSVSTDANGAYDLTGLTPAPFRIVNVNYALDSISRFAVPAASLADGPQNALGVKKLFISYIPGLAFPASGSDAFVWGTASLDQPLLDDLLCLRAASTLTVFMDQANMRLEALIARAEADVKATPNPTTWKIMPLRGRSRDSGFAYVLTSPTTLQLINLRW